MLVFELEFKGLPSCKLGFAMTCALEHEGYKRRASAQGLQSHHPGVDLQACFCSLTFRA